MNNKKISSLLNKGIKFESLKMLNETQINTLYNAVIGEQESLTDKVAGVQKLRQVNAELQKDIKKTIDLVGEEDSEEELNEWGSSDQHFFNQSIHKQLGEPEKMPSPFSPELESAVEDAVDFYWDDWEEYQTDRDSLLVHGKRAYLRSYFRDDFNMLVKMFEPASDDGEIDENITSSNALGDLAMKKLTGQETPHDEDDMAPDGMDDDSDNNRSEMGEEVDEEFKSKSQQKYFFVKCEEEGPKSEWCKRADEFADDTKDFSKLPEKVETNEGTKCWKGYEKKGMKTMFGKKVPNCVKKESKEEQIRQIEESIVSLVKKYVPKRMSKKDLLNLTEQSPGTKEAPVKTPTRTKPERKTPYKPKHKPAPKAGDTKTAPTRVKPGTKEKPDRKTPYKPKHKPAPKAGKKELPSFLKFNTLNIKFRDEKED
jgi:hypothetical protein